METNTDHDQPWLLYIMTGAFFDTTGALSNFIIPVLLEEANDLFADMVFALWFRLNGMKYSKTTVFGTYIVKFFPLLNILPEYTLMMVLLYLQDRAKKKVEQVVQKDSQRNSSQLDEAA